MFLEEIKEEEEEDGHVGILLSVYYGLKGRGNGEGGKRGKEGK